MAGIADVPARQPSWSRPGHRLHAAANEPARLDSIRGPKRCRDGGVFSRETLEHPTTSHRSGTVRPHDLEQCFPVGEASSRLHQQTGGCGDLSLVNIGGIYLCADI